MKKFLISGALALGLAVSFAPAANAQTTDELLALIAQLQAQLNGGNSSMTCNVDVIPGATLRVGSRGQAVMDMQNDLNDLMNAGLVEDGVYGNGTATAVMNFQAAYGLQVDGVFGAQSATALVAELQGKCDGTDTGDNGDTGNLPEGCTSTEGYSPVTGEACDANVDNGEFPSSGGDEASLEKFDLKSEDDAQEDSMEQVATIEFDVEDGDAKVERLDLTFEKTTSGQVGTEDEEPWDVFDTITLMADGDEIAEEAIDDEDDWNRDDSPFVFRLNDLDYVVEEGDKAEIEVYLTSQNTVRDYTNANWTIYVDDSGVRTIDTAGITSYTGDKTDKVAFNVDKKGGDEDITIRTSSNDPDSSTLKVDENDKSDWYDVFVFDLEAEENDIDLEHVKLDLDIDGNQFSKVVDDAKLVIDGDDYDDYDVTTTGGACSGTDTTSTNRVDCEDSGTNGGAGTWTSQTANLDFDIDKDATIDEGDRVEVALSLKFNKQDNNYVNGETVQAGNVNVKGEGVDDVSDTTTFDGDVHTLQVSGIMVDNFESSYTTNEDNNGDTKSVTYTMNFDVEAFDEDVYIPLTVNRGASTSTGITFQIEDTANNVVATNDATTATAFTSEADISGSYFVVYDGDTEGFTLKVTVSDNTGVATYVPGFIRAQLLGMNYKETSAGPADESYEFAPANDYDTSAVNIEA